MLGRLLEHEKDADQFLRALSDRCDTLLAYLYADWGHFSLPDLAAQYGLTRCSGSGPPMCRRASLGSPAATARSTSRPGERIDGSTAQCRESAGSPPFPQSRRRLSPAPPVSMYSKTAPSGCRAMSLAPFGAGAGPSTTSPPAAWRAASTGARLATWIVAVRSR